MPYYQVGYNYMQIPRFRRGISDETFFADPEAFIVPKHSFNHVQVNIENFAKYSRDSKFFICLSVQPETFDRAVMEELNTGDQFPSELRFFDDADIAAAEAAELAAQEAMSVGSNVAVRFTDDQTVGEVQQMNSSLGEPEIKHESAMEESGHLHSDILHSSSPMNNILANEDFHNSMPIDREFASQNFHSPGLMGSEPVSENFVITEPVKSQFASESFDDGPMFVELTGEMSPGLDFGRMDKDPLGEGFVVVEMNDEFGERFDDAVARTLVKRQAQVVRQPRPFRPVPVRNQVIYAND